MRKMNKTWIFALALAILIPLFGCKASAKDLDEILDYEITIDVNPDGTLNMIYHVDWKVLDSSSEALTWVKIGIPNNKFVSKKNFQTSE